MHQILRRYFEITHNRSSDNVDFHFELEFDPSIFLILDSDRLFPSIRREFEYFSVWYFRQNLFAILTVSTSFGDQRRFRRMKYNRNREILDLRSIERMEPYRKYLLDAARTIGRLSASRYITGGEGTSNNIGRNIRQRKDETTKKGSTKKKDETFDVKDDGKWTDEKEITKSKELGGIGVGKEKRWTKKKASSKSTEPVIQGEEQKARAVAPRPNYFIAVPIKSVEIRNKLERVQKCISDSNKKLTSALVPLHKTHITLMVMHLKDQEQIDCATKALASVIEKAKTDGIRDMALNFEGLGHFRNQVLFAKIAEDDGLRKLRRMVDIVRDTFTAHGLSTTDDRAFQAHMAVAKLSRDPKLRFRGVKKIDGKCYEEFENEVFGREDCSKLQLLCMNKTDKSTGYYHCVSELALGDSSVALNTQRTKSKSCQMIELAKT